jgi:hypothetical protein
MNSYRVQEVVHLGAGPLREVEQRAETPEEAARIVLGEVLMRGGAPRHIRAKVYSVSRAGSLTLVRLYSCPAETETRRGRTADSSSQLTP